MVAAPSCGVYMGKWDGVFVEIEAQIASRADGETVFFSVVGASGSPPVGRLVRRCRKRRRVAGGHGGGHEGGNLEDFRISAATADGRNIDCSGRIIIIIIQQQQHPSINTSIDISSSSSTPASTSASTLASASSLASSRWRTPGGSMRKGHLTTSTPAPSKRAPSSGPVSSEARWRPAKRGAF